MALVMVVLPLVSVCGGISVSVNSADPLASTGEYNIPSHVQSVTMIENQSVSNSR